MFLKGKHGGLLSEKLSQEKKKKKKKIISAKYKPYIGTCICYSTDI